MKFHLALFLLVSALTHAQDKIITLSGDTLPCRLSVKPWKEGIRTGNQWQRDQYGYYFIVAHFSEDSVRVLYPGQIAGFYHHQHTNTLPGGFFESVTYQGRLNTITQGEIEKPGLTSGFFRRIYQSAYISVYDFVEEHLADLSRVFFVRKKGETGYNYFSKRSDISKVFADAPALTGKEFLKKFKFKHHHVLEVAAEYSRLRQFQEVSQ